VNKALPGGSTSVTFERQHSWTNKSACSQLSIVSLASLILTRKNGGGKRIVELLGTDEYTVSSRRFVRAARGSQHSGHVPPLASCGLDIQKRVHPTLGRVLLRHTHTHAYTLETSPLGGGVLSLSSSLVLPTSSLSTSLHTCPPCLCFVPLL
jgi:hypothetical protein